jgi:hypothetical protein
MTTSDIIKTTLEIIHGFKRSREDEPGVWDMVSHYESQIRDIEVENVDDQRRVYKAADKILGIIGRDYEYRSFDGLGNPVIDQLRKQIAEEIRAL